MTGVAPLTIAAPGTTPSTENSGEYSIDVHGLNKSFGTKQVVHDLSLKVRHGEIFGFLGPNGSGKTTSIRMMCGLLTPDSGSGTCLGFDIIRQSNEIKRRVGYMTQRFSFWEDLSIRENLDFVARLYQMPKRRETVDQCLEGLGLTSRAKQLAGALSGGWKQRLALAACMLHQPDLLLLDEPTAGVDPKARREFWEEIHQLAARGISVLVSTHYMDEAERCHKLAYIAYGELLTHGTVAEVVAGQGLHTYEVHCEDQQAINEATSVTTPCSGGDIARLSKELQNAARLKNGVEQVVAFGNSLHISGHDPDQMRASLDEALKRSGTPQNYLVREIPSSLEDVFISLMTQAQGELKGEPGATPGRGLKTATSENR